ncbi:MAG TPA: FGGY family carbohydrate kinase, partial [Candidatus Saccharimonadales bacterium]|nr:FGGY family carbohydrate kinase [Candidatus Saccharimonadales bacterium]
MPRSTQAVLLGIDIGTYSSKGVACLSNGTILAEARLAHGVSAPRPGQVEHDADAVWWHDLVG